MTHEKTASVDELQTLVKYIEDGKSLGYNFAEGIDSAVYRSPDGSRVVKVYKRYIHNSLSCQDLLNYKKITNLAANRVASEKWTANEFPVEVVPIDEVFESDSWGKLVTISRYIAGPNLSDLNLKFLDKEEGGRFRLAIEQIHGLSIWFNQILGTEGISVGIHNTKLVEKKGVWTLIITDLCNSVSRLRIINNGKI